ncbi:MAG TPA: maleylpyruvate isomerase family mycothiol-dependent enzyme [Acidimicrobiales bacterium]|nr:maleylpyruvate isomerase family mycothiol-dependent enzyme [Acidimicrobiales bacterium]
MSTIDKTLQALVGPEYLALADVLDAMDPAGWDTPSLCAGWRVREVVAHMTMAVRYSEEDFMAELRDCEFDFTRLSNRVATRDAELPTADLLAHLRSDVMQTWTPPGGGYAGALNHVVVHSLDVTVPLGRGRVTSDHALGAVLDGLTAGGVHEHFGTDIGGLQLVATDLEWSHGEGTAVRASGQDLVLMLTGRLSLS